ncbi:MAG: hypothetical protein HUU16_03905 [Candidatus Omnitrophica bacterium]|nr:hypothetical protein [bacterium]NUN95295.1 hypothetical protein [Candidatus Omnitrophota bacterium]
MIDIGTVNRYLHEGPTKDRIDRIQTMGRRLAARVDAVFNLIGRRAAQFESPDGTTYHALIHNEADDETDYLVVHPVGVHDRSFEAMRIEGEWAINYIDPDVYEGMLVGIGDVVMEYVNDSYKSFILRNEGVEPEPLDQDEMDLDAFSIEMSHRKIALSHQGNMRLAF